MLAKASSFIVSNWTDWMVPEGRGGTSSSSLRASIEERRFIDFWREELVRAGSSSRMTVPDAKMLWVLELSLGRRGGFMLREETKEDSLFLLGLKMDFWVFPKWWWRPFSSVSAWFPKEVLGGAWLNLGEKESLSSSRKYEVWLSLGLLMKESTRESKSSCGRGGLFSFLFILLYGAGST